MPNTNQQDMAIGIAHRMPRSPVLGWSNFQVVDAPRVPSVEDLPHTALTSSGRAAIYQALLQLQLPKASAVLVPTYHCPTIVAPVVLAQLEPVYYGIRSDGLPNLASIDVAHAKAARAMVVPHYFGLGQSLAEVRAWCDQHGIALIEDCAHCYFGEAGERPIGAWGDFATASLSKFFPVPDAGVLASARRPLNLNFEPTGLKAQIKCAVDVLELAAHYRRLPGFNGGLSLVFRLKNAQHHGDAAQTEPGPVTAESMMRDCNMARIAQRPPAISRGLKAVLPHGRIIARRQRNFALYAEHLRGLAGAQLVRRDAPPPAAPYVFPLRVEDADRVYHAMRAQELPVFRWDRIWPGTPHLAGDVGPDWSRHVLQLLCHQDLSESDVVYTAQAIRRLLTHP